MTSFISLKFVFCSFAISWFVLNDVLVAIFNILLDFIVIEILFGLTLTNVFNLCLGMK